jgi:hypothetical protein
MMLTPGVSLTLVVQRVVSEGRGAGFHVAAGTASELLVHGATALVGLAALVKRRVGFETWSCLRRVSHPAASYSLIRPPSSSCFRMRFAGAPMGAGVFSSGG